MARSSDAALPSRGAKWWGSFPSRGAKRTGFPSRGAKRTGFPSRGAKWFGLSPPVERNGSVSPLPWSEMVGVFPLPWSEMVGVFPLPWSEMVGAFPLPFYGRGTGRVVPNNGLAT